MKFVQTMNKKERYFFRQLLIYCSLEIGKTEILCHFFSHSFNKEEKLSFHLDNPNDKIIIEFK